MEYRKLGSSGTLVSALALGTMNFGTRETPEEEAFARQLTESLAAAGLHLDADATAALDAASSPHPAPYPYGPFGSAQRDRTENGPEALGQLVQAHASTSASAS